MSEETCDATLDLTAVGGAGKSAAGEALALVVAWMRDEPGRVGEALIVPPVRRKAPLVFGRASRGVQPDAMALRLVRQRPGVNHPTPPLSAPRLSRRQLAIKWVDDETLDVENVGKGAMRVDGHPARRATVAVGSVVEIEGRATWVCVRRPLQLPADDAAEAFVFGGADGHGLVGESVAMWELRRRIAFVARRPEHVLVHGPSGTGKEAVSRALHAHSPRASGPFVARNAATLPEALVDAELFGNAAGYPNPGMVAREGMVGAAHGGSLFLDELGELPHGLQAHLLRVLDDGSYHRLGEGKARRADVRLIGATNRRLDALKHDLAARLTFRIPLPGLNDRPEDIPLLVTHLLAGMAEGDATLKARFFDSDGLPRLKPAVITAFLQHRYTTHVRELSTLMWRCLADSPADCIELSPELSLTVDTKQGPLAHLVDPEALSKEAVEAALAANNGVREQTWRALGLRSRHQLARLMKKFGM